MIPLEPITARVLRVFVSSPGDVPEERAAVARVAEKINRNDGSRRGYLLKVLQWETDAVPGLGDIQANVTRDLGPFEIYVGIMCHRFGTASPRAGSGTEEEFNLAFKAWTPDKSRPVMFYFRTAPLPHDSTDEQVDQWTKVRAFKKKLKAEALISEYADPDAFEDKLREDLEKAISNYLVAHPSTASEIVDETEPPIVTFVEPPRSHTLLVYLGDDWGDGGNSRIRSQLEVRLLEDDFDAKLVGPTDLLAGSPSDPLVAIHFVGVPSTAAQRREVALGTGHARWQLVRSSGYPEREDLFDQQLKSLDRARAEFLPVMPKDATQFIADKVAVWQKEWRRSGMPATKLYLDIPPADLQNRVVEDFLDWLDRCKIEYILRSYKKSPTFTDFVATIPDSKAAVFVFASGSRSAVSTRIQKAWGVASLNDYNLDLWGVFLASPAVPTVFELPRVPPGKVRYMDNIERFDEATVSWLRDAMSGAVEP